VVFSNPWLSPASTPLSRRSI